MTQLSSNDDAYPWIHCYLFGSVDQPLIESVSKETVGVEPLKEEENELTRDFFF
jgi:hypothetical protein